MMSDNGGQKPRNAIHIEDLSVVFHERRALDHLTLDVPAGIIFGLLGPNGAGKTTTIRVLLGLVHPSSGHAHVLGMDSLTHSQDIRQQCGVLLDPGLYERLSAEDNLRFYSRIWHLSARESTERIQESLTHIGLWERRKERVSTWSRGMKQRLAIARLLIHHPELIILDEPTTGLDPIAAAALHQDLLDLIQRTRVTILLTTHNLTEAEKLCSLVGIINAGTLRALGPPGELRERLGGMRFEISGRNFPPELLQQWRQLPGVLSLQLQGSVLTLALRPGTATAPLLTQLIQAGAEIQEARRYTGNLEDVFLSIIEGQ